MRMLLMLASFGAMLAALPAQATITQDTSRSALGGDATMDWGLWGTNGTLLSTPVFQPLGAVTVGASSSSGQLDIVRQGTGWGGNFAPGDSVLYQPYLSDSFTVSFSTPVRGVGAQIEAGNLGAFTGFMDFYGATNTLLGEVSVHGDATAAGDNSAVFIGGEDVLPDISYVSFLADTGNPLFRKGGNIGINRLDVLTGAAPIPEPAALGLVAVALCGLAWVRRRAG